MFGLSATENKFVHVVDFLRNKYICSLESLLVLRNFFFFVSLNNMLWKFIGKFVTFPRMSIRTEAGYKWYQDCLVYI